MAKLRAESVFGIHRELADNAEPWDRNEQVATLRRYCFRHGVTHILMAGEPQRAETLLTDFAYCMARLDMEGGSGARPMARDYRTTQSMVGLREPEGFQTWEDFFRTNTHLLERDNPDWPAHKILLQLAVEHADDSPVTLVAEQWLEAGHCDWVWLRRANRPRKYYPDPCRRIYDFGTVSAETYIRQVLELSPKSIAIRLVDSQEGKSGAYLLDRPSGTVKEFLPADFKPTRIENLGNGCCLAWNKEGSILVSDLNDDNYTTREVGDRSPIRRVVVFNKNDGLAVLGEDGYLRFWKISTNQKTAELGNGRLERIIKKDEDSIVAGWRTGDRLKATFALYSASNQFQEECIGTHTMVASGLPGAVKYKGVVSDTFLSMSTSGSHLIVSNKYNEGRISVFNLVTKELLFTDVTVTDAVGFIKFGEEKYNRIKEEIFENKEHLDENEVFLKALRSLSGRLASILALKWGLKDGYTRTFPEIGRQFKLSFIELYLHYNCSISELSRALKTTRGFNHEEMREYLSHEPPTDEGPLRPLGL